MHYNLHSYLTRVSSFIHTFLVFFFFLKYLEPRKCVSKIIILENRNIFTQIYLPKKLEMKAQNL